jgi:hypothetical protein
MGIKLLLGNQKHNTILDNISLERDGSVAPFLSLIRLLFPTSPSRPACGDLPIMQ